MGLNHADNILLLLALAWMKTAHGDRDKILNPDSGYESWLRGNVVDAVIVYDNIEDNMGESTCQRIFLGCYTFNFLPD